MYVLGYPSSKRIDGVSAKWAKAKRLVRVINVFIFIIKLSLRWLD
ncbi:MAG: hypothetical protein RI956_649 [Pseudomonadota bacterium]